MADIVPDRVIDMYDALQISGHFNHQGTYSTNLTDVTVTFNGGIQVQVDTNGFALIPPSCTSFTIKKSGTAIGAAVVFWSVTS